MQTIFASSPSPNSDTAAAAAADLDARAAAITEVQLTTARLAAGSVTGFPYPSKNPIFYVKFGNQPRNLTLMEAHTHRFVFDELEKMRHAADRGDGYIPYTPRIIRVIETETTAFIIMEFIHGATLGQSVTEPQIDQVAGAIRTLLAIPVPLNTPPGPYKGGFINHPLFKNGRAPKVFSSVVDLEAHIQMMCDMPHRNRNSEDNGDTTFRPPLRPRLVLESTLCVVHADPYPGNFLVDAAGNLFVLDFGHVALLPISFLSFALRYPNPQSAALAQGIALRLARELPDANLAAMARARAFFAKCSTHFDILGCGLDQKIEIPPVIPPAKKRPKKYNISSWVKCINCFHKL